MKLPFEAYMLHIFIDEGLITMEKVRVIAYRHSPREPA